MTEARSWAMWVRVTEASSEYVAEKAKVNFAVALERRMQQLGVDRAEFARRLGTTTAAVTMALRADSNLTIGRMAQMAHALEADLNFELAPKSAGA